MSFLWVAFEFTPLHQCRLTCRRATCRAQCSWALGWSFTVRTNSVSLLQRIAGTKTTGLWQLQQTLRTLLTWRKERWWEKTKIQTCEAKNTLFVRRVVLPRWRLLSLFGTDIKQRVQNWFRNVPLWVLQQCGGAQELCGPAVKGHRL